MWRAGRCCSSVETLAALTIGRGELKGSDAVNRVSAKRERRRFGTWRMVSAPIGGKPSRVRALIRIYVAYSNLPWFAKPAQQRARAIAFASRRK